MTNPTVSSEIEKLLNQIYQEDGLTFEEALSKLEELIVRAKIEELEYFTDKVIGKALAYAKIPNHWAYVAKDKRLSKLKALQKGDK